MGVGGVPIGPVRLSVIREKVEQRAVDGESLVWREGFDEWQPLKNVPGLRALLDEGRRASATPDPGPRATTSSSSLPRVTGQTPPPGQLVTPLGSALGAAPTPAPAPSNGSNGHGLSVGALSGGLPGTPPGSSLSSTDGVALGSATSANPPSANQLSAEPSGAGLAAASPFALPATPAPAAPLAKPPISVPPPRTEESSSSKGLNPFAYAMIAMAAVFGGVAAFVLLTREPAQVIVVQTAAPETGLAAAPPPPPTADGDTPPEPVASASAKPGEVRVAGGGSRPAAPTESAKPGEVVPPPNAGSFDTGVNGPTAGPGKDGAGSAKGQLSEGEISSVVSRNQPAVRRRCWQPALDARSSSAPKSARVSTTITIGPSGAVTSASASGSEQHYPGLSGCIGSAIRGWQFPPSDGTTTVNVPFSFVSQ